jgi:1,4-dihydroxy-2-naphthoyl-CoA synthase
MSQGDTQWKGEKIAYEVADGVATVTLNDPQKRNMLSGQMLSELVEAMKLAKASEDVRAAVSPPTRRWSPNTSPPTSFSSSSG